jgi:hypothetical protein
MKVWDKLGTNFYTRNRIIQSSEKWHTAAWQMAINSFKELTPPIFRAEEQGRVIALFY